MEDKKERVWVANQLNCLLPPTAVKMLTYVISWQSQGDVKYYDKQFSKFLHMSEDEVELAIQTLVDGQLIHVEYRENNWYLCLNKDVIKKFYNLSMQAVHDHPGLKQSEKATWKSILPLVATPSDKISGMTLEQMKQFKQMLELQIIEHEQVQQLVRQMAAPAEKKFDDGLPF